MKLEKEKEEQYGKQILVIGSSNTDMVIKVRAVKARTKPSPLPD